VLSFSQFLLRIVYLVPSHSLWPSSSIENTREHENPPSSCSGGSTKMPGLASRDIDAKSLATQWSAYGL